MQAVRRAHIMRAFALALVASAPFALPARAQAPDTSLWVTDGVVVSMLRVGSTLYIGGHFDHLGGQARFKIGAVDAASGVISAFDPSPAKLGPTTWPYVRSLAVGPGVVYAGGQFLTIGGQTRHWIAALDPASGAAT